MVTSVVLTVNETLTPSSLQARIDKIPIGLVHMTCVGICGVSMFFHAASFQLPQFSVMPLLVGIGLCCLATHWTGKRPLVITGLVVSGLLCYLGSLSQYSVIYLSLALIGCGLGLPASVALTMETFPSKFRGLGVSILMCFWIAGEFYLTATDHLIAQSNNALRLELLAIPVFVGGLAALAFLNESPMSLQDDCYALNSLLARMDSSGGSQIRFSPQAAVCRNEAGEKKNFINTLVLGIMVGLSQSFLINRFSTVASVSVFSLLVEFIAVLVVGGSVALHNPRIASITFSFLLTTVAVIKWFPIVEPLIRAAAVCLAVFCLVCGARDVNLVLLFSQLTTCLVTMALEQAGSDDLRILILSIVFGIAGLVAALTLREDNVETSESSSFGFKKIPIIKYGSL